MCAVDSIIWLRIVRPQEEVRKERAKGERKAKGEAKAREIRKTNMEGKAKACRHWIRGVGVKEEIIRLNHNHHHHHGCNNRPGSAAWAIGAAWASGADNRGQHGETSNRGRGEIR